MKVPPSKAQGQPVVPPGGLLHNPCPEALAFLGYKPSEPCNWDPAAAIHHCLPEGNLVRPGSCRDGRLPEGPVEGPDKPAAGGGPH